MNHTEICMFVTMDKNNSIGNFNENTHEFSYPWKIKEELDFFMNKIKHVKYPYTKNVIISGRRTWEMYKERFLQSDKYIYIIISNTLQQKLDDISLNPNTVIHKSLRDAINYCNTLSNINKIIISGGKDLYTTAIEIVKIDILNVIKINYDYKCNIFFPIEKIDRKYILSTSRKLNTIDENTGNEIEITLCKYDNKYVSRKRQPYKQHEEYQYIHTIEKLVSKQSYTSYNDKLQYRTLIGIQYKFNLNDSFPLFTTNKIELLDVYNETVKIINDDTFFNELSRCINDIKILSFDKHLTINYKIGNVDNVCFYIEQIENTVLLSSMLTINYINVLDIPMEIAKYSFLIHLIYSLLDDSNIKIQLDRLIISFGKIMSNIVDKQILQNIIKKTPYHFPKLGFLIKPSDMLSIPFIALKLDGYKHHT